MHRQNIPVYLDLLKIVAQGLAQIKVVFRPGTAEFKLLKTLIKSPVQRSLNEDADFLASPMIIKYTQLLFLLALSMYKGSHTPMIKQISQKNETIHLIWEGGIKGQLNLGKFDEDYKKFISYYKIKILGSLKLKGFSLALMKKNYDLITDHYLTCSLCKKLIISFLKQEKKVTEILNDENNFDLLFMLISSLPTEQLNAIFIYIQQFFPEKLEIKVEGRKINVLNLWQTSTLDAKYLVEKVKIYYELYLAKDYPIIRHITQSKTKEFLEKTLTNPKIMAETQKNLENLSQNQVDLRMGLYNIIIKQMDRLLKKA